MEMRDNDSVDEWHEVMDEMRGWVGWCDGRVQWNVYFFFLGAAFFLGVADFFFAGDFLAAAFGLGFEGVFCFLAFFSFLGAGAAFFGSAAAGAAGAAVAAAAGAAFLGEAFFLAAFLGDAFFLAADALGLDFLSPLA